MIKIAFIINYIVKNGPSRVVLSLINNLDRKMYEISLITLFSGNDADVVMELRKNGVTVFECSKLNRLKCLLGYNNEFKDIVKNGGYDILHTHGLIPDVLSSRLNISSRKITTLHNNMYEDYANVYGKIKSRFFVKLHLMALRKLDKCICCSKSVYEVMKKNLYNVTYIRNGIDADTAEKKINKNELSIPETAVMFSYVGHLSKGKNIKRLIELFNKYHNESEYLLVIGEGQERKKCEIEADDHVKILGFQSNPYTFLLSSDVYISASQSEGFSISVLEALSFGLVLLVSDIPSHREAVTLSPDLYLGETFDFTNEKSFYAALQRLREKMTNLDKKKISEFQKTQLSAKAMTSAYETIYLN